MAAKADFLPNVPLQSLQALNKGLVLSYSIMGTADQTSSDVIPLSLMMGLAILQGKLDPTVQSS